MWIESHSDIWNHFKTRRLQKHLGIPLTQTVGHLLSLWHFTLDNSWQTGDLERWGEDGIEDACRWAGQPGALINALREVGYLDEYKVHDWFDYAGELVRKRRTREMRRVVENSGLLSEAGVLFEKFWAEYPRQVRRVEAAKVWLDLNLNDPAKEGLVKKIMEALAQHKGSLDWARDGGTFIPFPNTWLEKSRWEERLRAMPEAPPAPQPKCDACGLNSSKRLPNSVYCKECAWCVACDDNGGIQMFAPHELRKGADGRPSCPDHMGGKK